MFWKTFITSLGIAEVFKNSYISEIEDICNGMPGVRALLIDKKNLFVWNYDTCTHAEMMTNIAGTHKFSMIISIVDNQVTFQRAANSCKEVLSPEELMKIPSIKKLICIGEPLFFAFN